MTPSGRQTEEIHRRGPWKGLNDVEFATLERVAWYNGRRLLAPLRHVPAAELEQTTPVRRLQSSWRDSTQEFPGKPAVSAA